MIRESGVTRYEKTSKDLFRTWSVVNSGEKKMRGHIGAPADEKIRKQCSGGWIGKRGDSL